MKDVCHFPDRFCFLYSYSRTCCLSPPFTGDWSFTTVYFNPFLFSLSLNILILILWHFSKPLLPPLTNTHTACLQSVVTVRIRLFFCFFLIQCLPYFLLNHLLPTWCDGGCLIMFHVQSVLWKVLTGQAITVICLKSFKIILHVTSKFEIRISSIAHVASKLEIHRSFVTCCKWHSICTE